MGPGSTGRRFSRGGRRGTDTALGWGVGGDNPLLTPTFGLHPGPGGLENPAPAQPTSSCVMESTGAGDRKLPPGTWGLSRESGSGGLGGVEGGDERGGGRPEGGAGGDRGGRL